MPKRHKDGTEEVAHLDFQKVGKSFLRGGFRQTVNGQNPDRKPVYCAVALVWCVSSGRSRERDDRPLWYEKRRNCS